MTKIIPVILCGGSGTRLWPLSRQKTPKQFLKLVDDHTLLQKTAHRAISVLENACADILVITLNEMAEETEIQLKQADDRINWHILKEPEARNTAAAVAYAVHYAHKNFGDDCYLWVLPADHYVGNTEALRTALHKAHEVSGENYFVTFGIAPTRPETGYGYIQRSDALNGSGAYLAKEFHEKPNSIIAQQFVESGQYLWSSGMHMFRIETARTNFEQYAGETWNIVRNAVALSGDWLYPSSTVYKKAASEPFETAVLEKCERIAVVPCNPEWSDIGSWESLWEIKSKDASGNAFSGNVFFEDTKNSMILAQNRLVTCVGVEDLIIVETEDSVLVANKNCGNSLKKLVNLLREQKRAETVTHVSRHQQWGVCRPILNGPSAKIQECVIRSGQTYKSAFRGGVGQIISTTGKGAFVSGRNVMELLPERIVRVASERVYEIVNTQDEDLKIYEIWLSADKAGQNENYFPALPLLENVTTVMSNKEVA